MVKHIVFFKLKNFESEVEKQAKMTEIKDALEALIDKVSVLRKMNVVFNINPAEEYDLALVSEFDSLTDVNTYAVHPDHVAVGKNIIGPFKVARACVDYEF
jgi:Stress responsive A/B Barrel Domain.